MAQMFEPVDKTLIQVIKIESFVQYCDFLSQTFCKIYQNFTWYSWDLIKS